MRKRKIISSEKQIVASISVYDNEDNLVEEFTDTFEYLVSIPKYEKYYYRFSAFPKTIRERIKGEWFGVSVGCIGGLKFDLPEYLNRALNDLVKRYSSRKENDGNFYWILCKYSWIVLDDFAHKDNDLIEFCKCIDSLVTTYDMLKIKDLKSVNNVPGIYLMVLDDEKMCYIGQASKSIKTRIMRHWSRVDYFTGTGIDLYKAKDTSRLFYIEETSSISKLEHEIVSRLPERYAYNVLEGGTIDYLSENDLSLVHINKEEYIDYNLYMFYNPNKRDELLEQLGKDFIK